jgi:SET domain-containing protein
MIATADIAAGEPVAPARRGGKRTPAGRYTNHGAHPNAAMMMLENGDIDLVAIKAIGGCLGGMDGEEITVDYGETLKLVRGVA